MCGQKHPPHGGLREKGNACLLEGIACTWKGERGGQGDLLRRPSTYIMCHPPHTFRTTSMSTASVSGLRALIMDRLFGSKEVFPSHHRAQGDARASPAACRMQHAGCSQPLHGDKGSERKMPGYGPYGPCGRPISYGVFLCARIRFRLQCGS